MHEPDGAIAHTDEECEFVTPWVGQVFECEDVPGRDSLVVVFVRGADGGLQQLMWPMTLEPKEPIQ